ncbi:hypothetical protein EVAR_8331_1 [Eumeta japonica]|uniref:Uncharacterized protein n=1 Tax=Eumeta variegata TaxID=151549 RepID=A0A4C1VBI3_EUMVA|nr:hypothetical protein EVAR_8331_1 [Eumeta japonica]
MHVRVAHQKRAPGGARPAGGATSLRMTTPRKVYFQMSRRPIRSAANLSRSDAASACQESKSRLMHNKDGGAGAVRTGAGPARREVACPRPRKTRRSRVAERRDLYSAPAGPGTRFTYLFGYTCARPRE